MNRMRDDFAARTKNQLAARVGWLCSNPGCRQPTTGPSETDKAVTNVGVAAHITAASPDGPRFDPNLTPAQRRSADNGLWLCQKCAKAIDDDGLTYTPGLLRVWKAEAEARARTAVEQGAKLRISRSLKRAHPPERVLRMLIAEDDGSTAEHLARIFQLYRDHLSVTVVTNVGDAIGAINENRPDILLLDLMMPYGQAAAELGEESDPDWMYTGLRLLRRIREQEKGGAHPIWVGVITARNSPGTMQELRQLLGTEGRLYPKPFNDIRLEHEIVSTFGIPSKVPPQLLRDVEDW